MNKKSFQTVCLLIMLSILISSVAYAFIYETRTQNVTQTIKKIWYNSGWQYRKSITIQGSQVPDPNTHSLDATGGYMNISSVNWGSVTGTISFWIKWDSVSNRPWGQHDNMETRFSGSNIILDWGASDSLTSGTSFIANKWYFIAIVWNESTDKLYLYVGDENNPPVLDAQNNAWTSTVSTVGVTQNNFMASKGGVNPTDGKGDDLRYWNTNRTLAAIQSDYNNELTGSETNLRSYFKLNNDFNDIGPNNNDGSGVGSYTFSSSVPAMVTYFTNFPVLVSLTDSDLASKARNDGWDILFTSSDKKTKLSHGIENFTKVTGILVAWVKVPILFTNNNTLLYMYYGNPSASDQQNATNVWDDYYVGVWHLKEDPSGTAPQIKDSTSNANNGTSAGSMTSADQVSAKINGGLDFDGVNDYINIPRASSIEPSTAITVYAWFYWHDNTASSYGKIVAKTTASDTAPYYSYCLEQSSSNAQLSAGINVGGTNRATSAQTITLNAWHQLVLTWNSGDYVRFYIDGTEKAKTSSTYSGSITYYNVPLRIGFSSYGESNTEIDGLIDEVRISNIARTAGWLTTEYNNQNNPSSFYSIGLEELH
jgi:hypothetical protein